VAAAIDAATTEAQRAEWAERLRGLGTDGLAERAQEGLAQTAHRVALIAAGELRYAARMFARLEEGQPKLPTAGKMEDLDAFIAASPTVRQAIAFAASPRFGGVLGR
jgi:hypothetical protein